MSHQILPNLKIKQTINHPADDMRVLGFRGRDMSWGRDIFALKAEELPTIRHGPNLTHFIIPMKEATVIEEDNVDLYILDEHYVYRIPSHLFEGELHTGTKYGQELTGRAIEVEEAEEHPRRSVKVST